MKAELVPDNGDPPIPITRDVTVVGRREYCDVVIDHSSLSKRHCVIVKTDGLLVVRDLASTNGTKVKGQKVRWAALLPDDRLTLGHYKFRIYLGPDDAPGPSEMARWGASVRDAKRDVGPKRETGPKANGPTLLDRDRKREDGFAAPSPLGTPVVRVNQAMPEEEEAGVSSWWDRMKVASEEDDVIIELD
jgi:predicted component of type VI protein secretion system